MKQSTNALIHLVLSGMAMIIVLLLVFAKYPERQLVDENARLLVGGAFITSCAFGISLALYPNWYKRNASVNRNRTKLAVDTESRRSLLGHHPDCESFESHKLSLRNRTVCAGCTGVSIGSILAVVATVTYIVLVRDGLGDVAETLTSVGLVMILLAFLETALPKGSSLAHAATNALLTIALLLTTVGLLEATSNSLVGLLGILFAYLWMDTRVRLSSWRHSLVCSRCSLPCKMY